MVRTEYMGRVTCEAKVESVEDILRARRGDIPATSVRAVTIRDALVDTGASTLGLPASVLRQLGLNEPNSSRPARNTTGSYTVNMYGPVRLTIFDRYLTLDVIEVADGCPVLIGQIPLEHMKLVVDMPNHRLEKSPEDGGEWILDAY